MLETAIQTLANWNTIGAEILSRRFVQNKTVLNVAHHLHLSVDQVNRQQRAAITELVKMIYDREVSTREQLAQGTYARFPPQSYTQLFGIDPEIEHINTQLTSPDAPDVLALIGLGGIGKTSLADFIVRQIVPNFYFEDIIWLRINTSYHPKNKRQRNYGESELLADLLKTGDLDLVAHFFQRADKPILRNSADFTLRARLATHQGDLAQAKGNWKVARFYYEQAAQYWGKTNEWQSQAITLIALAEANKILADPETAQYCLQAAGEIIELTPVSPQTAKLLRRIALAQDFIAS